MTFYVGIFIYVLNGIQSRFLELNRMKSFADGINKVKRYMEDERIAKRRNLKKFVIVFSGFEAVRLHEL